MPESSTTPAPNDAPEGAASQAGDAEHPDHATTEQPHASSVVAHASQPLASGFSSWRAQPGLEISGDSLRITFAAPLTVGEREVSTDVAPVVVTLSATNLMRLYELAERDRTRPKRRSAVLILSDAETHLLRLIGVAPVPCDLAALKALFPNERWAGVTKLRRQQLVGHDAALVVPARVRRLLVAEPAVREKYEQVWVTRLTELQRHPDMAPLLAIMHARAGRLDEAALAITEVAYDLEPGQWNHVYLTLLSPLGSPVALRRVKPKTRAEVLNCLGLCLSRVGRQHEAVEAFVALAELARRHHLRQFLGYALINQGVAKFELGELAHARSFYEQAIARARLTRDSHLLARATHNLGMLHLADDPLAGEKLLRRSIRIKAARGDAVGILVSMLGRGIAFSKMGADKEALGCFRDVLELSEQLDLRHITSTCLVDTATSLVNAGKAAEAIAQYQRALTIARTEGFSATVRLGVQGLAVAHAQLGHCRSAEKLFDELAGIVANRSSAQFNARHDAAVMRSRGGDAEAAVALLANIRRDAWRAKVFASVARCAESEAAILSTMDRGKERDSLLGRTASALRRSKQFVLAGNLLGALARHAAAALYSIPEVEKAFRNAAQVYRLGATAEGRRAHLELLKSQYVWACTTDDVERALSLAREVHRNAIGDEMFRDRAEALDEEGTCLRLLGRFKESESAHRHALRLARRAGAVELIENVSSNLGLLLQQTARPTAAISYFDRALATARLRKDVAAEAAIDLNRALALLDLDRLDIAESVFKKWRRRANSLGLMREFVAALHGCAHVVFKREQFGAAASQYDAVLQRADSLGFREISDDAAPNFITAAALSLTASGYLSWRAANRRIAERAVEIADSHGIRGDHVSFLHIGIARYWLHRRRNTDRSLRALGNAMVVSDSGRMRRIGLLVMGEAALVRLRSTNSTWKRQLGRLRAHLATRCRTAEQLQTAMWPFDVGVQAMLDSVASGMSVDAALHAVSDRIDPTQT